MITFHGDWPDRDTFNKCTSKFTPFVVQGMKDRVSLTRLLTLLKSDELSHAVVDVSCIGGEAEFSGSPQAREYVHIPFHAIFEGFQAALAGNKSSHWTHNVEGLNLYLAQTSLINLMSHQNLLQECPNPLIDSPCDSSTSAPLPQSPCLPDIVTDVNLWMNLDKPVVSSLHYDGNHNLLLVYSGMKRVTLLPPSLTSQLRPYPAYFDSPNHSYLNASSAQLQSCQQGQVIELQAGDALFIPEGWWHLVESKEATLAINWWFKSPLQMLLDSGMAPYVLRTTLHELVMASQRNLQPSATTATTTMTATTTTTTITTTTTTCPQDSPRKMREKSLCEIESNVTGREEKKRRREEEVKRKVHNNREGIAPRQQPDTFSDESATLEDFEHSIMRHIRGGGDATSSQSSTTLAASQSDIESILLSCSLTNMRSLWPSFAKRHPQIWYEILMSLSPSCCASLMSTWESQIHASSEMNDFMISILNSPWGRDDIDDRALKVRKYFIQQRDIFLQSLAKNVIHELLLTTPQNSSMEHK